MVNSDKFGCSGCGNIVGKHGRMRSSSKCRRRSLSGTGPLQGAGYRGKARANLRKVVELQVLALEVMELDKPRLIHYAMQFVQQ